MNLLQQERATTIKNKNKITLSREIFRTCVHKKGYIYPSSIKAKKTNAASSMSFSEAQKNTFKGV